MFVRCYPASNGIEYFISMESEDKKALFGFCRLRIPSSNYDEEIAFPDTIKNKALIRELHVYGSLVSVIQNELNANSMQHSGIGKKLIKKAENIAFYKHLKMGTVVISGIGVRNYYKKLNYNLENNYMVKSFYNNIIQCILVILFAVTVLFYNYML